jgi:hypothetical protein
VPARPRRVNQPKTDTRETGARPRAGTLFANSAGATSMHWYQWLAVAFVFVVLFVLRMADISDKLEREQEEERKRVQQQYKREREEAERRAILARWEQLERHREQIAWNKARHAEAERHRALVVAREQRLANPTRYFYDWLRDRS